VSEATAADVLDGRAPWAVEQGDCLDVLRSLPDASVDAVVTDPPYGIRADRRQTARAGKRHGVAVAPSRDYGATQWDDDRPSAEVFGAILRVGRDAVIFGGNYFADMLPPSASWVAWDKDNGTNGYADFELAWTSHKRAARKVRWRWHGMIQEAGHREQRVHPTQKPVGLMRWIVREYTRPGDTVLDPYCGSGSTGVACMAEGRRFIGIEREPQYVKIARARIAAASEQPALPLATGAA
jgi:DNA modification methylase